MDLKKFQRRNPAIRYNVKIRYRNWIK